MNYANLTLTVTASVCIAVSSCKWNTPKRQVGDDRQLNFGEHDLDRNGFLNVDELGRYMPEVSRDFETIDLDRDRQVSEEELRNFGRRMKGDQ